MANFKIKIHKIMYGLALGQNLNHKTLCPTFLIENTTIIHKYINNILKCKI